jgi:predicted RNase H-like nuclease (RuvC/YqgF family)
MDNNEIENLKYEIKNLQFDLNDCKSELIGYKHDLERAMEIISEFQGLVSESLRQNECEINFLYDNLDNHTKAYHAMLIIGNKKDENK